MTSLTALVAGLAGGVERATVGSGAVSRNMAELAASIALHRLRLAITSEVVWATALVTSSRARAACESTASISSAISTTANWSTTAEADGRRVGASAL